MSRKKYIPARGHIIFTNFNPSAGQEQAFERPALVLSPEQFNKKMKLALVAPITSTVRGHGFEVNLVNTDTTGVVLCQQIKVIDYVSRGVRFIEDADPNVLAKSLALAKLLVT